jgi:hypothetical protein
MHGTHERLEQVRLGKHGHLALVVLALVGSWHRTITVPASRAHS